MSPFQLKLLKSGKILKIPFRAPQQIWHAEHSGIGVDYAEMKVYLDFTDKSGLPQGLVNEGETREFKYALWTTYYEIDPGSVSKNLAVFCLFLCMK